MMSSADSLLLSRAVFERAKEILENSSQTTLSSIVSAKEKWFDGRVEYRLTTKDANHQVWQLLLALVDPGVIAIGHDADSPEGQDSSIRQGIAYLIADAKRSLASVNFDFGLTVVRVLSNVNDRVAASILGPYAKLVQEVAGREDLVVLNSEQYVAKARELFHAITSFFFSRQTGAPELMDVGNGASFYRFENNLIVGRFIHPTLPNVSPMYVVLEGEKCSPIVFYSEGEATAGRRLARLVRTFMSSKAERSGVYCLHASAVYFGEFDGCFIFCGDSYAGKTTAMLNLLADDELDCNLVSNDRIFLDLRTTHCETVYGFPHAIGVRSGTFTVIPKLASRVLASGVEGLRSVAAGYNTSVKWTEFLEGRSKLSNASLHFDPDELGNILGRRVVPSARLLGLIVLQNTPTAPSPQITIEVKDIAATIERYSHVHHDNGEPFWDQLLVDESEAKRLCSRGGRKFPVVTITNRAPIREAISILRNAVKC